MWGFILDYQKEEPFCCSNDYEMFNLFFREFQPMVSVFYGSYLSSDKIPIGFWYRRELYFKSLIQSSETLPVKLTEIHMKCSI